MAGTFPLLFSPIQVGKYTLRNRIVNTGHGTRFGVKTGTPTEQHIYYHRERARGGLGMIVMETMMVHRTGLHHYQLVDDSVIPGLRQIADAVHPYGVPVLQQLNHYGRKVGMLGPGAIFEQYAVAPSTVPFQTTDHMLVMPHELGADEIAELVKAYGEAARRCAQAGLDGVELTMGFGNLIPQFMVESSNRRTDRYGGSLEKRLTFPLEVMQEVRSRLGPNRILGARFSDDFLEYTTSLDDLKLIIPRLVASGLLDYVNMHVGSPGDKRSRTFHVPSHYYQPGQFVYLAAAIKKLVKVPVLGVGRINTPVLAEQLLQDGQCDLVGMVRELIADPHLPNKAREGRADDIRRCMACNQSCTGHGEIGLPITCIYNPVTGREKEWGELRPAQTKKQVLVVGGGPAGMEAARVLALRGHRVVLMEKTGELGGQVNLAVKTPKREDFGEIRSFFEGQLPKLGVEVRLHTEATAENVLAEGPDAVVVATGASPYRPEIPGMDGKNVVTAHDVMAGAAPVGRRVVVYDAQGLRPAMDVADYLSERGAQVEMVTGLPYVGLHVVSSVWRLQYQRLLEKGVVMSPLTGILEVGEDRVTVYNTVTMAPRHIEGVDTVVVAAGGKAEDGLYKALKGKLPEVYAIGDCWQPRDVEAAVYEGHKVARSI